MSIPRLKIAEQLELGCTDHGCIWGHPGGMGTNGGCHCLMDDDRATLRKSQRAVRQLRLDLIALEAKLAAAERVIAAADELRACPIWAIWLADLRAAYDAARKEWGEK